MGFNWTEGVMRNSTLSHSALKVLIAISRHADIETGEAWPTRAGLAAVARVSEETVRVSVHAIEDAGEATVVRGRGRGHKTHYFLNPNLLKGQKICTIPEEKGRKSVPLEQ